MFAIGDAGHEVLIVRSGSVKVLVGAANGREVILEVLHAGELLGEMSAVDEGPRSATALTLEPTEMLVVGHREFERLSGEHASGKALLMLLARRLRGAGRR